MTRGVVVMGTDECILLGVMDTITLTEGDTRVEIVPARGALVTRLVVKGQELLYLDRATLDDPAKHVRGGIPVLFPFAGRLEGDRFLVGDGFTTMKQHGFGRNLAWEVASQGAGEVVLSLAATEATRAVYPYEFRFAYRVTARAHGVGLGLEVHNLGDVPLPVAPGWHPYFRCADKRAITTDVAGLDPARFTDDAEFDFGLPFPGTRAGFVVPGLGDLTLAVSENLRYLQLWSQPGKPFVCLEPFAGPPGVINGTTRDEVAPEAPARYQASILLG
jgi:galactose mutarotase-like enzyme